MKLRIIAILLALLALLTLVGCKDEPDTDDPPIGGEPPSPDTADPEITVYASGEIEGTALRWELRSDDTLYILGEGAMPEDMITRAQIGDSEQPWGGLANTQSNEDRVAFRRVVVEDSVTGLSQLSFKNCGELREVVLGAGITKIPYDCFTGSAKLQKVTAKSVTFIDENAFQGCRALCELTLGKGLTTVEIGAFSNAATEKGITLRFAGTAAEFESTRAALTVVDPDEVNRAFADALEDPVFLVK